MKDSIKKLLSLLLCIVLCAAMTLIATGCNDDEASEATKEPVAVSTEVPDEDVTPEPEETATEAPEATSAPTAAATAKPTVKPTATPKPTAKPTAKPTTAPAPTATPKKTVSFTVTVKGSSGSTKTYTYETDKSTVGAALLEKGLIAGDQSQYGLYVKVVDGETADWDTDGTYWAFYVNGEYAMTGVDSTPIEAGATYGFVRE